MRNVTAFCVNTRWCTIGAATGTLLLCGALVGAILPDAALRREYADIYQRIRRGDLAVEQHDFPFASNCYQVSLTRLLRLQEHNPTWETNLVAFRIAYCRQLLGSGLRSRPSLTPVSSPHLTNMPLQFTGGNLWRSDDGRVIMQSNVVVRYAGVTLAADYFSFAGGALRSQGGDALAVATGVVRLAVVNIAPPPASNEVIRARGDYLCWRTNGVIALSCAEQVLVDRGRVYGRTPIFEYDVHHYHALTNAPMTAITPTADELRVLMFDESDKETQ